jgi:hypothetical protein
MKHVSTPSEVATATLQDVLDRIAANPAIGVSRRRDLRSAVLSFGKLADKAPSSIPVDLGELRHVLDETDGTLAKISAKRRANLRSDLTAAIETSGVHPILRTSGLDLDLAWKVLLDPIRNQRIQAGLSRFARWCSLNGILPETIAEAVVDRFAQDLKSQNTRPECPRAAWRRHHRLEPLGRPEARPTHPYRSGEPESRQARTLGMSACYFLRRSAKAPCLVRDARRP